MGTYKVIQDIEAEDKLLGPLTLRQFIYAGVVIVQGFIVFKLVVVNPLLAVPFLPPMAFFGLLAAPFGHDQSSEVWLLAKFRFMFKPRRRIWDQSGIKDLVHITVPKKIERQLTDGLSQSEVRSRLRALADTIDSRGWAVKNVNVSVANPTYGVNIDTGSDRLVAPSNLPQAVPNYDVTASDDIMDEHNNATAQQLDTMIQQSEQAHRQALVSAVQSGQPPQPQQTQTPQASNDYWFMNQSVPPQAVQPGYAAFSSGPVITPGSTATSTISRDEVDAAEAALHQAKHHEDQSVAYGHTKVLKPHSASNDDASQNPPATPQSVSATDTNPDIIRLANNDDLNVATIAREAQRAQEPPDDEVVISLH